MTASLFGIVQLARRHRKAPTPSEALLWRRLCHSQLGVRVRRQHPMQHRGFYVAAYRLVVEVNGAAHPSAEAQARDALRTAELARLYGVRVLRLPAGLVERDVEAAVARVRAARLRAPESRLVAVRAC